MPSRAVTLIVHGTFAAEAAWWRLGEKGDVTFADRLEQRLAELGSPGTVWRPALDAGFDYSRFTWSGRNRDRDRRRAARQLATTLEALAKRMEATPEQPLTVDFVAHSHGGNVVLDLLGRLRGRVRAGAIVLLGTPLITVRPACRAARLVLSAVLMCLALAFVLYIAGELLHLVFTGNYSRDDAAEYAKLGAVEAAKRIAEEDAETTRNICYALPLLVWMGWLFAGCAYLVDLAWRGVCFCFRPANLLRGRAAGRAYGPPLAALSGLLGERPILLLTTRNDEAELFLQVGSAPAALYAEYLASGWSRAARVAEFVLLRPFVRDWLLRFVELVLEIFALGFSPWRTLWFDYSLASPQKQSYYPPRHLIQEAVDVRQQAEARVSSAAAGAGDQQVALPRSTSLLFSLRDVIDGFKSQIRLRHSGYYEDPAILERVVRHLRPDATRVTP